MNPLYFYRTRAEEAERMAHWPISPEEREAIARIAEAWRALENVRRQQPKRLQRLTNYR